MRVLLFLILFVIILIFAPFLFLDMFLIGAALIKEIATDPMWKYFFYVIGGIFALGILSFLVSYNDPKAKKQREYHAEQLKKLKGKEKDEFVLKMVEEAKQDTK